jgi:hypothetical protein
MFVLYVVDVCLPGDLPGCLVLLAPTGATSYRDDSSAGVGNSKTRGDDM